MSETTTIELLLNRAHLFITEGQEEEALETLAKIQADDPTQQREIAYLRAWCCTLHQNWDEAAQFLFPSDSPEEKAATIQSIGQTERRRRAQYLLLLGDIAVNIERYEEATGHYTQCIRLLDERRMNVVSVRIKARMGLGTSYTQTGFYAVALTHYKDALRLCEDDVMHTNLPDIYYGLCDTHRHLGNFDEAFDFGKRALQLYVDRSQKDLEGRMRNLLGRVCYQMREFHESSYYYTEALTLALSVNSLMMILANLTALADLRREEGLLDEAWRYCQRALEYEGRVQEGRLLGMLYLVCGKVVQAQSENASNQQEANLLVNQAIEWYQKADVTLARTQAKVELAETYGRLAQLLETCGQQDKAIKYWKFAYSAYSRPQEG